VSAVGDELRAPDYGVCPLCLEPLAEHAWAAWRDGASERRGVWFSCAVAAAEDEDVTRGGEW
jgi:hypothetical protein